MIVALTAFIYKHTLCKLNNHYHPEHDGLYLAGFSHGVCYGCGKFIRKDFDYVWRETKDN